MDRPNVVFITRSPRFDTSSAMDYGTPVFLFNEGEVSPFNTDRLFAQIRERLADISFGPNDYVALTGPAALVALFTLFLGSLGEPLKLLLFDARHQGYKVRHVALSGAPEAL